ncbi:DUF5994 family protein [Gordonia sp. CPCC 205333]|uniref:DUF5994 family protein n=1 Tax=Gordonia sp. CPCC 205333 TaxID=3140790 RepID=UPI003AF3ACD8
MTAASDTTPVIFDPPRQLRLRLKPAGSSQGVVDGAWWPHSRNLVDELPQLLQTLSVRLPHLERVGYRILEWERPTQPKGVFGDCVVRLEGFNVWPPDTLRFVAASGVLVLAVIAPHTNPADAHTAMMGAAGRTNVQSAHVLAHRRIDGEGLLHAAEHDWDSEGGHVPALLAQSDRVARSGQLFSNGTA